MKKTKISVRSDSELPKEGSKVEPKKKSKAKSTTESKERTRADSKVILKVAPIKAENQSELSDSHEMSHAESFLWEDMEECGTPEKGYSLERVLSRTSWLIEDHCRFKAARVIQAAFRGWFERRMFFKRRNASITIQTEWRRFHAKRVYYKKLENTLQQCLVDHYFRAAQCIQALFRGWWVRMHVHDQYRLTRLQVTSAEELLQCIAFKLHHLLRTHQIPGVYSLRNSNCLSKVEKLLTTISFKQHNHHVRWAAAQRAGRIDEAKHIFKESAHATAIPFSGPNLKNLCDPKCSPLYNQKDTDRKMYTILSLYERAGSKDARVANARIHREEKLKEQKLKGPCDPNAVHKSPCTGKKFRGGGDPGTSNSARRRKKNIPQTDFCTDVVESMKRWNILSENHLSVDPNVFKKPEKLEHFLEEIESIYNTKQKQCHCKIKAGQVLSCEQTHT